jgi:hypothetical protein
VYRAVVEAVEVDAVVELPAVLLRQLLQRIPAECMALVAACVFPAA